MSSISLSVLREQRIAPCTTQSKFVISMLSLAICDALGGPAEFQPRDSFPLITTMLPNDNFTLPPGTWTDDTSMMLCLATSLMSAFSEADQLACYARWWREGYLSATGVCVDIGVTVRSALTIWSEHEKADLRTPSSPPTNLEDWQDAALRQIRAKYNREGVCGNGSLMRVLPIGLAYWLDPAKADVLARRSSTTTHPNRMCQEACALYTRLIVAIMQGNSTGSSMSKLDLLRSLASYPLTDNQLRTTFSLSLGTGHDLASHPLLHKSRDQIPSSGFVLHTLEAALWVFFHTMTFEEGAIAAVNLGDDADTVAAVYGGLAGCWYGHHKSAQETTENSGEKFQSRRVQEWMDALVKRDIIEGIAIKLETLSSSDVW